MYPPTLQDEISFTLIYKFINNQPEDGSKKSKHVAECCKFTKYLIKSCNFYREHPAVLMLYNNLQLKGHQTQLSIEV